MKKYVYSFGGGTADGDGTMKDSPRRQRRRARRNVAAPGVPVPPGFTISTEVCNIYFKNKNNVPEEIEEQIAKALAQARKAHGQEAGRCRRSAAAQRALRREILHAGHDEHHPQPRPERRDHRRPRRQERQPALRLRLLPPLHPDVRRSGARYRHGKVRPQSSTRAKHKVKAKLDTDLTADDLQAIIADYKKLVQKETSKPFPAGCRTSSLQARPRRRVPLAGGTRRRSTTARWKRFPTRSAPPPTCRPWCSATWATLRHRRRLHARSRHRRKGLLRRVSDERAGRRRGGRHPHAAADLRARRIGMPRPTTSFARSPPVSKSTTRTCRISSSPSGRQALHAADPQRQAHRSGGGSRRGRDGGRRHDRRRRKPCCASRPSSSINCCTRSSIRSR